MAAVTALLVVGLVCLVLLVGGGGDGGDGRAAIVDATPTPTATATPTRTPKPKPTPTPLTAEQRAERDRAAETVKSRGYDVVRLRDFDPDKTLQVLIGRDSGGQELAFFFVDGEYIGNDSTSASSDLSVRHGGGDATSVVLGYATYVPGDAADDPSGDPVDVTFRWDGTRLAPQEPLPDPTERTATG